MFQSKHPIQRCVRSLHVQPSLSIAVTIPQLSPIPPTVAPKHSSKLLPSPKLTAKSDLVESGEMCISLRVTVEEVDVGPCTGVNDSNCGLVNVKNAFVMRLSV